MNTENKNKRKMDDNVSSKPTKIDTITKIVDPESKKICLFRPSSDCCNHYLIPQGMIWSNNSCAYDSIFTILFSIWCNNKNLWTYNFHRMNNPFIIALSNGFNDVDNNIKTLETIRDDVRRNLHRFFPQTMAFGNFTSVENIFAALLETTYRVQSVEYRCCNNHVRRMNDSYSLVLLNGTGHYNSIQELASRGQEETRHMCTICNEHILIKYGFDNMPSLFVFEFSNQVLHINLLIDVQLQNNQHTRLRLAGVIYYGQHHFTAQIFLSDGQVWFYDGIDTGRNLIYNGSINSNLPSILHCRGKQAVAAIYVCL
jgi:hypothetical protein